MTDRYLPTFDQLHAQLADIEHACSQVRERWRWAAPDAFRRPKHGSRELVSGGEGPDTADTVADTERFRVLLRHAARECQDARSRVLGAVADLNDALALLEPPPGAEVADVRLLQHPADRGDLARAKAAQGRREQRAAASGDWSEVTG